jgi:hypothetical protein
MENEVVRQLLLISMPVIDYPDESRSCSIKVFDVEYDAETGKSPWPPEGTDYSSYAQV